MPQYDNTNRGSIWKNDKKTKDTHADFTGSINVDGTEYWLNGWLRKKGAPAKAPAMSFTVRPKSATIPKANLRDVQDDMDDQIPF